MTRRRRALALTLSTTLLCAVVPSVALAQQAAPTEAAARLAAIRRLLDGFDWEFHDRQLALEAIERIVDGAR